jgi:hypothetical protein
MIQALKIFLIFLWLWMVYVVISTSLESGLFEQWDFLASIPWMRATLWDFYANILVIYLWVIFREHNLFIKIMWGVLFSCLGSIATIAYLLIQLFALSNRDSITTILQPKFKKA